MTSKKTDLPDLNVLAIEACDMWQEHLSSLAGDPSARAELTRFLEPQRRLFADWAAMMQGGTSDKPRAATPPKSTTDFGQSAAAPAASGPTNGDDPLRSAQLALRLAELEKRVAYLEERAASSTRKTQRSSS